MVHPICVDHSRGRAFISEGVIFYSPNCHRQVTVPTRFNGCGPYRFEKRNAYLNRFQTPEWWTTPYGYLSFVTLLPSFNGAAFSCLRDILSSIEEISREEYVMKPRRAAEWTELETNLIQISSLLNKQFLVGAALNPIPPSLLGFHGKFKARRSAILRVTASRDWFVIWMGLLSFIIGHVEFLEYNHAIPDWFQYLVDKGIPQTWLSGFHQSGLCNFSQTSLRVGVFIDWLEKDNSRPCLEFFTSLNVPVWYPWTTELGNLVARNPALANLRPPPEQLQSATTFIMQRPSTFAQLFGVSDLSAFSSSPLAAHASDSKSPARFLMSSSAHYPVSDSPESPPQPPASPAWSPAWPPASPAQTLERVDMSHAQLLAARLAHAKTKPWLPFFQAREARNSEKAAKETPEARERRLNRERKPPQKKVEVFVWDWSDEDPLQLVRIRVMTNRERQDALESYSPSQSIYNSWSNEWDLCDYFGDSGDDDNDDEGSEYQDGFGGENEPGDNEEAHAAYIDKRIQRPLFSSHELSVRDADPFDNDDLNPSEVVNTASFDILDYLSSHYGFVSPLLQQSSKSANIEDWNNHMKALGRVAGPNNPPVPNFHESIIRFIDALHSREGPNSDNFDVFPDNRVAINSSRVFGTIHYFNQFFVVLPHAIQSSSWTIALYDLPRALFVYRLLLKDIHTPTSLARILLDEGVAFRTVMPLADVYLKSSLSDIVTIVPIRLSDYVFKPSDYEVYVHQRAMILSSPRGRAALLRGGIVGRLAREHLSIDSACLGPSPSVTIHRIGFNITDKHGVKYWDDDLTENEINVICGLHHSYTGNGSQQALVSWWPLPVQWNNTKSNGYNWGYWTQWDESWYCQRLKDIQGGHRLGVPFAANIWRTKLKGASSARLLHQGILAHTEKHFFK